MDLSKIFFRKFDTFAIDISDTGIRAVRVKLKKGKIRAKKVARFPLPPGIIVHGLIRETKPVIKALKKTKARIGSRSGLAIVSIADDLVFLHTMSAPKLSEDKIREFLSLNAPENLPYPKDQAYFGFEIIKEYITKNSMDIVVGAARADHMEEMIKILHQAGIKAVAFEPHSISVARILEIQNLRETWTFADVRPEDTLIGVVSEGRLIFRELLTEGITSLIGRLKGLGLGDADIVKALNSHTGNAEADKTVADFYADIATHINRVMRYRGQGTKAVYFASDIVLGMLGETITRMTGLKAEELKLPTAELKVKNGSDREFFPAVGSALRTTLDPSRDSRLSVMPYSISEFYERFRQSAVVSGLLRIMFVTLTALIGITLATDVTIFLVGQNYAARTAEVRLSTESQDAINRAKAFNALLESEFSLLSEELVWDEPMRAVLAAKTSGIKYTGIRLETERATMDVIGVAVTREELLALEAKFEDNPIFSNVNLPPANLQEPTNIQFSMTLTIDTKAIMRIK